MAGAGAWTLYNDFKLNLGKKLCDMVNDSFKVALVTSASSMISASVTPATYAALVTDAHEVASGNGYTTAGAAAGSQTWTGGGSTATITFDTADVSWTASGSGFTARAAVLYDDTAVPKVAVAFMLLDSTPADVTVAAGNTLTVTISNVFTYV